MAGLNKKTAPNQDHGTGSLPGDWTDLMRAIKNLVDPYRPELHYMRGPGPRWHAKHDDTAVQVDAVPVLVRVKG
jgi:hypothetical protein